MGFDRLLRAYALAYCWLGTPKRYAFRYRPRRFRLKICHRHIFFTPKPSRVRIRRTDIYRKDRFSSIKLSYGGESGIRTHGTLPYDGFQDRSVITTSVSLRIPKKAKRRLRLSFSECYYNKLCRPCQCKILIFSRHGRGWGKYFPYKFFASVNETVLSCLLCKCFRNLSAETVRQFAQSARAPTCNRRITLIGVLYAVNAGGYIVCTLRIL